QRSGTRVVVRPAAAPAPVTADDDAGPYAALARDAASLLDLRRPVLFGISGAVGVGKSTTAELVRAELDRMGVGAEVVCTDGFLFRNAELAERGLSARKGFPETFDTDALADVLGRLRAGEAGVVIPVYSHLTYDRVPGPGRTLSPADVVIAEGVNVLQPPVNDLLDMAR